MYGGVLKNYLLCVQKYLHATAAWLFIIARIAFVRAIAMVAIVRECVCCAVENERHFGEFVLFVVSLHIGQEALVHVLCTNDEQGSIGIFTDDGGIGNNLGWRTVEKEVAIITLPRPPLEVMNSMFVRITRKASLMTLRE